jgi:hypothetical protein
MLSKTHKLTEAITNAIGPILRENPDYGAIQQAMGLVLARIAQSTPNAGDEHYELEIVYGYAKQALTEFLRIEAKAKLVDEGINGFAAMFEERPDLGLASLNGGMGAEAQAAAEEAQGKEGPTYEDIQAEEAEQARLDTFKEDQE